MSWGSAMQALEASMQSLPDKLRDKVDRFVAALREAAHDIYRFAHTVVTSVIRAFWIIRLVLYILFGFIFLFSIGIELIQGGLNIYRQIMGWLFIIVGIAVILVWFVRLLPVTWRSTQPAAAANSPRSIPNLFFFTLVGIPVLTMGTVTAVTTYRFQFAPLRFSQTEMEPIIQWSKSVVMETIDSTKAGLSRWSEQEAASGAPHMEPAEVINKPEVPLKVPPKAPLEKLKPIVATFDYAKVKCEPEVVSTRGAGVAPDKAENRIVMRVESIDLAEENTTLHMEVVIQEGAEQAFLTSAKGAYLTDDSGHRYDLSLDDSRGFSQNGQRELKFAEVAKLDLVFPKLDNWPKFLWFSHPQFTIMKLNTAAWMRRKKVVAPVVPGKTS